MEIGGGALTAAETGTHLKNPSGRLAAGGWHSAGQGTVEGLQSVLLHQSWALLKQRSGWQWH